MAPVKTEVDRSALHAQIREKIQEVRTRHKVRAPEFPAHLVWLNVRRPKDRPVSLPDERASAGKLSLAELRGKIVLLDFWTYCCINCMHVIPDLKYLEEKYAGRPVVVIGVHSAKFTNEKDVANIREAVLRYEIEHPVVVDSDFAVWQQYAVRAWPTLVMIDPEGYIMVIFSGEGNREIIDNYLEVALAIFEQEGKLNPAPLVLLPEISAMTSAFLRYPGKIAANPANHVLAIADSNHHRILILAPDGKVQDTVGCGLPGLDDGDFETAHFFHPQGMAFHGTDLIVCDTDNHCLRRIDFTSRSVTTIAGTGEQAKYTTRGGAGLKTPLNSPWDIFIAGNTGYIAMAGPHQIWTIDLKTHRVEPFAGSGHEARRDGDRHDAAFAQPSGITGELIGCQLTRLFVADSEISSVRQIDCRTEKVTTLVGGDLFQFGDMDGTGDQVRLQHPLGITCHEGKLYLADTYNHKIKVIDPNLRTCKTLFGTGEPGHVDGVEPRFYEPSGLAFLGSKLYIADTNNHAIRVADLHTGEVKSLKIKPRPILDPGVTSIDHLVAANTPVTRLPGQTLSPNATQLVLNIELPAEMEFNAGTPLQLLVRTLNGALAFDSPAMAIAAPQGTTLVPFRVLPDFGGTALRLELLYYYCHKTRGVCMVRQVVYEMTILFEASGSRELVITDQVED
ncbi:MAG: thioredoxin-like domain-containing protein [candidate division KSB1 bacterium]|nr:thioredoxin-like domain-containing protein [candidate division KSB1 bacterium]MDZ7302860.1 thioredoxin-like domain-containing protein [candidate division KSB1 bacterium]MDZ7311877.1 thioredoxin-like domain-containing protein [candidate division KSB1 bacterium]